MVPAASLLIELARHSTLPPVAGGDRRSLVAEIHRPQEHGGKTSVSWPGSRPAAVFAAVRSWGRSYRSSAIQRRWFVIGCQDPARSKKL